ncbi:MAG: BspA family leucine-rich repeat surface protein, partial [Prevotella sp.]|nr:BspA family leucine-rich repeat surface protein [Prevotella sp.]
MKKKFLLFILASLFAITQDAWAAVVKTPQVIWCESNTTLYFINSETVYAEGGTYDGQTVTNVWSGNDVVASPTGNYPRFHSTARSCARVVFDESFASVRPTSCFGWFSDFSSLRTIEGLENLNTSDVTTMTLMFGYCPQLTSLDLSNFNTAKVTNMRFMFNSCKVETIYVSNGWTVENVTSSDNMFDGCESLKGGQGTTYNDSNPKDKTYAHIDGGASDPGYLTLKYPEIALDETKSDNSTKISNKNGINCNVTLDRTIVPGSYNTLCLPFDVDNVLLKEKFGEDVELAELSGTHMDNETLYFDFAPADAITAGVPYLIYVSDAVESPITFNAVTVKNGTQPVTTSLADFIPVFDVTTLDNGNENILFLGANNTLYYPSASSGAMKGFRAYFEVKGEAQGAKAMVMMDNS